MPSRNIIRNSSPPCLSVSEAPQDTEFLRVSGKETFLYFISECQSEGETRELLKWFENDFILDQRQRVQLIPINPRDARRIRVKQVANLIVLN